VHLHANDREGVAHLCGYGARPPLALAAPRRAASLSPQAPRRGCRRGDGPQAFRAAAQAGRA